MWNSLRGRGMDIFWNYNPHSTTLEILVGKEIGGLN